jgi:hypothetical protein
MTRINTDPVTESFENLSLLYLPGGQNASTGAGSSTKDVENDRSGAEAWVKFF